MSDAAQSTAQSTAAGWSTGQQNEAKISDPVPLPPPKLRGPKPKPIPAGLVAPQFVFIPTDQWGTERDKMKREISRLKGVVEKEKEKKKEYKKLVKTLSELFEEVKTKNAKRFKRWKEDQEQE